MANEKRLIDAAEARKHSTHDIITHFLDRCPTVDAVEVVHGKWDVEVGMNYNKERICPVCNKHIESNYWNHCPNCGAKMDGGNEDG